MNAVLDSSGAPGSPAIGGSGSCLRILVVDDDESMRHICAAILKRAGYHVDTAVDGVAGWEAICANDYDLLLTDYNMPQITGIELLEKMRGAGMTMPAILCSGAMPEEELNRHPELFLSGTLLKPFSVTGLRDVVVKALRQTVNSAELSNSPPPWPFHNPKLEIVRA